MTSRAPQQNPSAGAVRAAKAIQSQKSDLTSLPELIDRETGQTSFAMVKELKGGFKAFMFQSVASIFGHNLKETYDPEEQKDIEAILNQAGYNSYSN